MKKTVWIYWTAGGCVGAIVACAMHPRDLPEVVASVVGNSIAAGFVLTMLWLMERANPAKALRELID